MLHHVCRSISAPCVMLFRVLQLFWLFLQMFRLVWHVCLSQPFWLPAAAVSAHCSLFGSMPALSCLLQPFRLACPCSALFCLVVSAWMDWLCVACHVMTLCVDHGSSATPQLELDYTCSSGRSLCVLLARHVQACVARHVTTCGHALELSSSSCHWLLVMCCSGVSDM